MAGKVWFEDLRVGRRCAAGPLRVEREEALEFARRYDPQPYHTDEAAAQDSVFKGLAISGWHTAAYAMRLVVEARPFGATPILGLGVDELRWLLPVRPGDELRLEGEVVELVPSRSKPQGVARVRYTLFNQRSEPVYGMVAIHIVPTRP